jgi:hypothetical protein
VVGPASLHGLLALDLNSPGYYIHWAFIQLSLTSPIVILLMILSLGLILVPIIPGVRSIPRWIPSYKIIWRDYYRHHPLSNTAPEAQPN